RSSVGRAGSRTCRSTRSMARRCPETSSGPASRVSLGSGRSPRPRPWSPCGGVMSVPSAPGPNVPFPPQEAELVEEIPTGPKWQYEPKWDGFRGVLENDNGELAQLSSNGRPLLSDFADVRALGARLAPH